LRITTGIADHINDRMHKAESMNKVIDIQKRFKHDDKMPVPDILNSSNAVSLSLSF